MKPKKPTPKQRVIINAVRWCKRQITIDKKERELTSLSYVTDRSFLNGRIWALEDCALYLNKKLPKELRVKI